MAMTGDLIVELEKTAASTDVLSGTDLEQPYADGTLFLWAASTVNTATLEAPQLGHDTQKTMLLRKRTDGIPSMQDDPCITIALKKGKKPIIVLAGTTGTCHFTAVATFRRG